MYFGLERQCIHHGEKTDLQGEQGWWRNDSSDERGLGVLTQSAAEPGKTPYFPFLWRSLKEVEQKELWQINVVLISMSVVSISGKFLECVLEMKFAMMATNQWTHYGILSALCFFNKNSEWRNAVFGVSLTTFF